MRRSTNFIENLRVFYMTARSEDFIIMSFALWAGDYRFLDSLITKITNDQNQTDINEKSPESIIYRLGNESLEQYKNKRERSSKEKNSFGDNFLETIHLRAKIWQLSDYEYCMRGFLKNLDGQEKIFSQFFHLMSERSKNDNLAYSNINKLVVPDN